jgi:glycosyltransferase involved in cell wall biosynthesis
VKFLLIGPFPPILNGVTVSNDYLHKWLLSKGDKVTIINTESGVLSSAQGEKNKIRKMLSFLWVYRQVWQVIGKDTVYITIGQTFFGILKYYPFVVFCRLLRIPYVLHIHGGYLSTSFKQMSSRKQSMVNHILQKSRSVIALSESLANQLKKTFPEVHVSIVENFYAKELIDPSWSKSKSENIRFLYLSNLMIGKGILEFLDALILLKERSVPFTVAIAGAVENGLEHTLKAKLAHLEDCITFLGVADFKAKKHLLYNSDVFVLPTWYVMEGQPISMIEAYVTQNIVVSTQQGGIPDISNYKSFIECPAQNSGRLADILELIAEHKDELISVAVETAKETSKRFDPERFGLEIRDILVGLRGKVTRQAYPPSGLKQSHRDIYV